MTAQHRADVMQAAKIRTALVLSRGLPLSSGCVFPPSSASGSAFNPQALSCASPAGSFSSDSDETEGGSND